MYHLTESVYYSVLAYQKFRFLHQYADTFNCNTKLCFLHWQFKTIKTVKKTKKHTYTQNVL